MSLRAASLGLALCVLAAPRAGAVDALRVAVPNPILEIDPVKTANAQETFIVPLIYEHLFLGNSDGDLTPQLVESWAYDEAKSRLTVRLKPGHHFSDGSEVTASDVVASMRRYCSPKSRTAGRLFGLKRCGASEARLGVGLAGPREVYFDIATHPSAFLYQLAFDTAVIMKKHASGAWLGSGPFRTARLKDGSLTLEANPYGADSRKNVPRRIEFSFVPESSLPAALKSQAYDVASMYLSTVDAKGYAVVSHAPCVTQTLVLNPGVYPFDRAPLRRALAAGLERSGIELCRSGSAKARGFIPHGIGGSLPAGEPPAEPDWAAARLDKPADATIYRSVERRNACEEGILTELFAKLNVRLKIDHREKYSELFPLYLNPRTSGFIELFVFPSREASSALRRLSPETREPYFFYTKPEYRRLIQQALGQGKISERFAVYRRINAEMREQASVLPLYYVGHVNFVKKSLLGDSELKMSYNPNSFLFLLEMPLTGASR